MARVFLGFGSNEGDRFANLSLAAARLAAVPGITLTQMAPIIETEPVGGPPQEPFLNTAVEIETAIEPRDLLRALKSLEQQLGRVPGGPRWGPRPIDLDILLYDDRIVVEPELVIPHPRLHERRFMLEPLSQLAPDRRHPVLKRSVADLLSALAAHASPPCV